MTLAPLFAAALDLLQRGDGMMNGPLGGRGTMGMGTLVWIVGAILLVMLIVALSLLMRRR